MNIIKVRCINPPAINRKQRISLWHAGDVADVPDDGFWRGLVSDGVIELVENKPEPDKNVATKKGRS